MAENSFNITNDHMHDLDTRSTHSHILGSPSTPAKSLIEVGEEKVKSKFHRSNKRMTENIRRGPQRQMQPLESRGVNLYPMQHQRQDVGQNKRGGRQFQQAVGIQRTVKKGYRKNTSSDILPSNRDNSLQHKRSGNSSLVSKANARNIAHVYPEYSLFDNPSSESEYLMKLAKKIKEMRLRQDPNHQLKQTKDHNDDSFFNGRNIYKDHVNHQFNQQSQTQYKQSWQQRSTHYYSCHDRHENYEFAIVNSPRFQQIIQQMRNNAQLRNEGSVQTPYPYQEFGHGQARSQNQNHLMNPNHILNQRSGRYQESDYNQNRTSPHIQSLRTNHVQNNSFVQRSDLYQNADHNKNGTPYHIQSQMTNHISQDDQQCEIVLTVEAQMQLAVDMFKQHGRISFPPPLSQPTPVDLVSAFQEPLLKNGDIQEHTEAVRANVMQGSAFEAQEFLLPVGQVPDFHSSTKEEHIQTPTLNYSTSSYSIQEIDFHYSASQEFTQVSDTNFSTIQKFVHETDLQYSANQELMLELNMNSSTSPVCVQKLYLHYSVNQEHMQTHNLISSSNLDHEQTTDFVSTARQEYEQASDLSKSAYQKQVQNFSCTQELERASDLSSSANREHEQAPDLSSSANREHEQAPDLSSSANREHEQAPDLNSSANREHEQAPDFNSPANREHEQAPDLNSSANREHEQVPDLNSSANREHEQAPDLNSLANQEPEQLSSVPTAEVPMSLDDLNEWPQLPHPGIPLRYRRDNPGTPRAQSGSPQVNKNNVPLYRSSA